MFTDLELKFFDAFGFLVWRQALSPAEIGAIGDNFAEVLEEDRRGNPFSGEKRQEVQGFLELRQELYRLLEDDRIYTSVEQLLGPDFVWIGSDGNLYVGDTRWHVDHWGPYRRLKVTFYLDPVERDSGCLRVIPGSHLPGFHDRLVAEHWPTSDEDPAVTPYGLDGSALPFFPLESQPGDIVFWNPKLFHSSYGGDTGRRMFSLRFGAKPRKEVDFENLRWSYDINLKKALASNVRVGGEPEYTSRSGVYAEEFLHSNSPRIQNMVSELLALGFR